MLQIADIIQFSRENRFLPNLQRHQQNAMILLSVDSPVKLCRLLKIPVPQLETIINSPVYKHYTVKKKRGGERHIFAPDKRLKDIQRRLNYFLQAYYLWIKPDEVHGFVIHPRYLGAHCNIVANACVHTGKKHILNIDLKDFFPGISAKRIKNLFTSHFFNYNEQIAIALTLLTTYESKLPTGAPTSPVLSNFVCYQLDTGLRNFCQENALQFSRYADDLTFSSDVFISQDTIQHIKQLIEKNGFKVNEKKVRLQSSSRKQIVTGLTVNEKVNVNRKLLKKIRAMLHDLTTNGVEPATKRHFNLEEFVDFKEQGRFIHRLKGYIDFVGQVRGKNTLYRNLKQSFESFFQ